VLTVAYFFVKNSFFLSFTTPAGAFRNSERLLRTVSARATESRTIHPEFAQSFAVQSFASLSASAAAGVSLRKGYISSAKYRKKNRFVQRLTP
ncbi:hypothetical protein, partial [Alistipes senegalensis]|uniref:hypothetical protein n=1 Tax=Alistipes senegalensis TaxID=1288121 RepID=UPI002430D61D